MKANKRVPVCKKTVSTAAQKTTVIIGGGAAGLVAAEVLKTVSLTYCIQRACYPHSQ
jgi:NADPH-dependent 2,4-dienoyl-CoA reductase/sulfur reductase-like enzyme